MNLTATTDPTNETTAAVVSRRLVIDLLIALLIFAASSVWGTRFWNAWTANGGQPVFYQNYFEPAVMVACGKGFAISQLPRSQVLDEFLSLRRDSISCSDLPADLQVSRDRLFQGAWIYLQTTVGWTWRIVGISWSRMGPLFGLLFGIVVTLVYLISRLAMGRALALVCAFGIATSYIHLSNLPHLRDYAKAPFTLALVLVLALLVTQPARQRLAFSLALAYGAVLGIGYGFRTDFLVNVPIFALVAFGFMPGGLTRHLPLKATASALMLITFLVISWPAASVVYQQGGCQWHVSLLGLQAPFDEHLHVTPAPYDFGHAYSDGYIAQTIYGYATRVDPSSEQLQFCSHEYDVQSGRLLMTMVKSFPADFITRAYGSVAQISELPFKSWASPLAGWATTLYAAREAILRQNIGAGVYVLAAAILIVSAASLRLALFLLCFVAYFGGYPAIQFQERHHFHLEFITWLAAGFVIHQLVISGWQLFRRGPQWMSISQGTRRVLLFSGLTAALALVPLWAARWYQRGEAVTLLAAYFNAPKVSLEAGGAISGVAARDWPQFLEIDLDQSKCGRNPAVTFQYAPNVLNSDLGRTVTVTRTPHAAGLTRIFQPVFVNYSGVQFSGTQPGCVAGMYRFADVRTFPLLLGAVLPPDWESLPLYQRLADWEIQSMGLAFRPLPDVTAWTTASRQPIRKGIFGAATIEGDRTISGYQATSPRVEAPVGAHVVVKLDLRALRGGVCVGALNGTTVKWLAAATPPRKTFDFTVDDSGGFMVAVSNCNPAESALPSRFSIASGSYAIDQ